MVAGMPSGDTKLGPRRRARLAGLSVACACVPIAAWGQVAGGLLPTFGNSSISGGLRNAVASVLPGAPTVNTGLAWTYSASLGVDVGLTQTSYGNSQFSGTDFTTVISPEIDVTGDTRRLTVRLSYSPLITLYAGGGPNQTYVAQNLNASATATIVPEAFFVDVRAVAAETSRFGGTQYLSSQFINSNDAVQTYSFSISPYFVHRFGGWGTFRAGYSYSYTAQDGLTGLNNLYNTNYYSTVYNLNSVTAANTTYAGGYGTTGNLGTSSEFASFTTGENLNRIKYEVDVSASQYGGGFAYEGSFQDTINNTISYALNHDISVYGSVGYQDIRYGGGGFGNNYRLSAISWAVGATLTPNPDSSFTIQYGRSYGEQTIQFSGSYAPGPRLRLGANYSIGISTGIQQQQQLLSTTAVGVGGILVDSRTGLPVVGTNSFGSQYGLSRVKQLSINASYVLDQRDTLSAGVSNQTQTTLLSSSSFNGALVPANTSASNTVGSVSWQRELNPSTSLSASASYGVFDNGNLLGSPGNSQSIYGFSANLGHSFTETLSGHVSYGYSHASGEQAIFNRYGINYSQNVFLVGLRKSF